ncbi:MAG: enoyl-CoA hydratase [Gammaproteobacteria bacterium]|nr:enoyl-CoA hydratase [Gammaproteobacteria bacterium]
MQESNLKLTLETDRMLATIQDGVGWMTFNNPRRHNALSLEMWQGIAQIIEYFERSDEVKVVVMTGAGGKAFVSGADISEFDKARGSAEANESYGKASARGSHAVASMQKPLIAKITGYCMGGGLATALHADIRFATEDSTFAIPAVRLGLGYDYEGIAKMARIVGVPRVRDIMLSGRRISAAEAYQMGLINFLESRATIDGAVQEYAARIAGNAPLTVKAAKAAANAYERGGQKDDLVAVREMITVCFNSEDYREGRLAFAEKRPPNFKGQ